LLWLFWRWGLRNYFLGLPSSRDYGHEPLAAMCVLLCKIPVLVFCPFSDLIVFIMLSFESSLYILFI
jgi:hypothetical protein